MYRTSRLENGFKRNTDVLQKFHDSFTSDRVLSQSVFAIFKSIDARPIARIERIPIVSHAFGKCRETTENTHTRRRSDDELHGHV